MPFFFPHRQFSLNRLPPPPRGKLFFTIFRVYLGGSFLHRNCSATAVAAARPSLAKSSTLRRIKKTILLQRHHCPLTPLLGAPLKPIASFCTFAGAAAPFTTEQQRKDPRGGPRITEVVTGICNRRLLGTSSKQFRDCLSMPNLKPEEEEEDRELTVPGNGCSNGVDIDSLYESYSLDQIRMVLSCKDDAECHGQLRLELNADNGIATLCLDSPQRKNAFSGRMMTQFSEILDQLEKWTEGRAVIIYGADEFFCSGADLKTVSSLSDKTGAYFISTLMQDNLLRLERLPLISVAMIEGKALGGGSELITACDFRVMTAKSQIGFVHARLGVIPAFGGGYRLIRLLGPTKALQMMLSASLFDARAAQQIGLVQHILAEGLSGQSALDATTEWFMKNYGRISPFTLHAIKEIVATGSQNITDKDALLHEQKVFLTVWGSDEHKRALASNIKHN